VLLLALLLAASCFGAAFAKPDGDLIPMEGPQETTPDESRWGTLSEQLEGLYRQIGQQLNIDYLYVKILHMLAGGKAVYADASPDIYTDSTVFEAFAISGASQDYNRKAPWITERGAARTDGFNLPHAAYNVAADVVAIMNNRFSGDRGPMQGYFDALVADAKRQVLFCEAVLQYIGCRTAADSFFAAYLSMLEEKEARENVLVQTTSGVAFKPAYLAVLERFGITGEAERKTLATILSFDGVLAAGDSERSVCTGVILPYEIGYTSRENMMIAAMSLVGKCRYVWGGGHLGTGRIKGINPMWKLFSDAYGTAEGEDGYTKCIVPMDSWCPLHGRERDWDGCLYSCKTSYSLEAYLSEREEALDLSSIDVEYLSQLLEPVVDFEEGMTSHRLDGLDCSGYTTWLFNQVASDGNVYDAGALYFLSQYGIRRLSAGTKLLPGDLFSWGDHIVVIVGPVAQGSKAYVMLEAGPSNVKFGVTYYGGAKQADINTAYELAQEANLLMGNMDAGEKTRRFSMNLRYSGSSYSDPWRGYRGWGRLRQKFEDQDTVLEEYGRTITELTAQEIIQHTMEQMPYQYLSGLDAYQGKLYDLESIWRAMTTVKTERLDFDAIVLTSKLM